MKIAFVTCHDVNNKIARSGVPYSIYHHLQQYYDVEWIRPDVKDTLWHRLLFALSLAIRGVMKAFHWGYMHEPIMAYLRSKSVEKQLKKISYDAVFSIDGLAIAFLNQKKPVFLRADAIAPSSIDYYVFNVPWFAKRWAYYIEKRTLSHVTKFFVASEWIIDEIKKYKIADVSKCLYVPTGANLDDEVVRYPERKYSVDLPLKMLIVGYNLKRKGFDVAYDTMKILRSKYNIDASLTVVGGQPDSAIYNDSHLEIIGKLNKNDDNEYRRFYKTFADANLFIFPTQAEYHGIVNCEAAAFGLPIFSYDTGGVSSYCIDGCNGRCLKPDSDAGLYAKAIYDAIASNQMEEFSRNSRKLFDTKFNWVAWSENVVPVINNYIKKDV